MHAEHEAKLDPGLREQLAGSLALLRAGRLESRVRGAGGLRRSTSAPGEVRSDHLRTPENSPILVLAQRLGDGELTSEDLVAGLLRAGDEMNDQLNVYATRFDDLALRSARHADAERRAGRVRGPLHGMPVAVKDVMATTEAPTTANSRVAPLDLSGRDAAAVRGLRSAGGVVLGKTTTMELASGMPDASGGERVPRNPWQLSHWTGGSSSGSAGGVAARLFPAALGSDTAGSIRIPAALCGVTGFKPTNNLRSLGGCLPLAPDMDSIGPIAESAIDCEVVLDSLRPTQRRDSGHGNGELSGLRIAVERKRYQSPDTNEEVRDAFESAVHTFEEQGVQVDEVELPNYELLRVAARVIWTTEAFANYGSHMRSVRPPTRDLLLVGAMNSGADYVLARRARLWGKRVFADIISPYVALLCPTRTGLAPEVNDATIGWQLSPHNHTSIWNLVGFPAVSVPMGFSRTKLPMGLQIVGISGSDRRTLAVAAHFQSVTTWHRTRPPMAHDWSTRRALEIPL